MKKLILLCSVGLIFLGAGCSSVTAVVPPQGEQSSPQAEVPTTSTETTPTQKPASATSAKKDIAISGFAFEQVNPTVAVGTTVVWTNNDSVNHTVTADDNSFDSGAIAPGETYTHAFSQTGSFAYHCAMHPSMKATVVVQ